MATNETASRLQTALADLVQAVARVADAISCTSDADQTEYVSARSLGIPPRTLRRLVSEGALVGTQHGREIFVRRVAWNAYELSQRADKAGEVKPAERPRRMRQTTAGDLAQIRAAGRVVMR